MVGASRYQQTSAVEIVHAPRSRKPLVQCAAHARDEHAQRRHLTWSAPNGQIDRLQIHRRVSGRRAQAIAVNRMNIRPEIEQQLDDSGRSTDDRPVQRRAAGTIAAVQKRRIRRRRVRERGGGRRVLPQCEWDGHAQRMESASATSFCSLTFVALTI